MASTVQPDIAESGSSRGRPRDRQADERILAAARSILATRGFDGLSYEAIAQMTGVTRATIYRRWPTKAHLANEIVNGGGGAVPDIIETHGLRAQVRTIAEHLYHQYTQPGAGAASVGLISAYQRTPALRDELHTPLESSARAELDEIVSKAKYAGSIRATANSDILFDLLVGAIIFRTMFSSLSSSSAIIDEITDMIIAGIAASS